MAEGNEKTSGVIPVELKLTMGTERGVIHVSNCNSFDPPPPPSHRIPSFIPPCIGVLAAYLSLSLSLDCFESSSVELCAASFQSVPTD